MFMDVSSEMIHALLPLYLVTVLGASTLTVGIIEGIAEATASITKIFSGALSDYLGKRKWLAAPRLRPRRRHQAGISARLEHRLAGGGALWGLHMGLTQGLLSALVADTAPEELRGTAFGMFNLVSGVAMLAASIVAGALWDIAGPAGTFLAGAAFTVVALAALLFVRWRAGRSGNAITSPPSAAAPRA